MENTKPQTIEKMAKCRRYEAKTGWYSLMAADGKVVIPHSFSEIKTVGYNICVRTITKMV